MHLKSKTVDLTEGNPVKQIVSFALPLLLGNIFQQLYNTVDSVVVGKYIGKEALAAVGSSGSLIQMLISLFMGISVGAGVVIARYVGARDEQGVHRAVHTNLAFGFLISIFLTALGIVLTPTILRWMGTPKDILVNSILYFRIYFAGISGNIMYNITSSIFRAVGDSRRPLYFLMVSSVLNVGLDLMFVKYFGWGIAGVAIATIIAQACSAILSLISLIRDDGWHKVTLKKIRIHKEELKTIVSIGLPTGLQNCIVSFSNVIVQSNINTFGTDAVAGCGAYNKVDGFALMPSGSFSMSVMTFVSQNIGAGKIDRAKKGGMQGVLLAMITVQAIGWLIYLFAPYLIRVFNDDPGVIKYGSMMARTIVPFYFLVTLSHNMSGFLRGIGRSKAPMFIMLSFWCILRITWITTTVNLFHDIRFVFWAYPLTWVCSGIVLMIYYKRINWNNIYMPKPSLVDKTQKNYEKD